MQSRTDNLFDKDNQGNQSTVDSNGHTVTKKNIMKKYQFHNKDTEVLRLKAIQIENKKSIELKKSVEFQIVAKEDDQIKKLFDEYVEKQKKKKMKEERKKNLTLEELYELRHKELQSLDVNKQDETNINLKLEGLRVEIEQTEKIFDNIKYVNKVQQIVQKSKGRLQHTKNVTKEEKFQQKLELFKNMKSYVEVDELLKNINATVSDLSNQTNQDDPLIEEKRLNTRQDRVQVMIEEMQKEIDSTDDPYKNTFLKRMKLLQKTAEFLKDKPQIIKNKSQNNQKGGLNRELVDFLKLELEAQLQDNERQIQTIEEVGDLQNYKLDKQIAEIVREQERKSILEQIKLEENEEDKIRKKYLLQNQNQIQDPTKEVKKGDMYKKFIKNSAQIMKYLSNASNQIYHDQVTKIQQKNDVKKKPFKKLSQYFEKKLSLQREKLLPNMHRNILSSLEKPNYNEIISNYEKGLQNAKINPLQRKQVQENQKIISDQQMNRKQSIDSIKSNIQIQKYTESPKNDPVSTFLTKLPEMDMKQQVFDALDQNSNVSDSKLQLKSFLIQCVQNQMQVKINEMNNPQNEIQPQENSIKKSFIKLPQLIRHQQSPQSKVMDRKISLQEKELSKKTSKHKSDRSIGSQQSTLSPEHKLSKYKYKKINLQIQQFSEFIKSIDDQKVTDKVEDNEFRQKIKDIMNQYEVEMKRFEPIRVQSLQLFDQMQNKSLKKFKKNNFKNEIL